MHEVNNGDTPASPTKHNSEHFEHTNHYTTGLTKREVFAMAAMQGLLSGGAIETMNDYVISCCAVNYADGLLKGLDE